MLTSTFTEYDDRVFNRIWNKLTNTERVDINNIITTHAGKIKYADIINQVNKYITNIDKVIVYFEDSKEEIKEFAEWCTDKIYLSRILG